MVASLQDLRFEMLPANIQQALINFGIKSTNDMRAMYDKYKDSPTMLNMGMQAIGLTPAAVDQIVAQASAKQQAANAVVKATPAKTAAPPDASARAPVRAAVPAPQPRAAAPQAATTATAAAAPPVDPDAASEATEAPADDVAEPEEPQATPDGEEDANTQLDPSVNTAATVNEVEAPAEQADDESTETADTVEPPGDIDSEGADVATDGDAASTTSAISDQDAAIEQLIANGRDPSVSGDEQAGAGTMASRAMPRAAMRGAGKSAAGSGPKQQAVMDDIVTQMMAQNAMQQGGGGGGGGPPQGMPPAGPQAPQMPPQAQRPPPPVAQRSQRSEQMISNLVKGARSKQEAQSKRGAPTGRK